MRLVSLWSFILTLQRCTGEPLRSITKIAAITGVGRRNVSHIINKYVRTGIAERSQMGRPKLDKEHKKINVQMGLFLESYLSIFIDATCEQMRSKLVKAFHLQDDQVPSSAAVYAWLKDHRYTLKVMHLAPTIRNEPSTILARNEYAHFYSRLLVHNLWRIVFLDETAIYVNMRRKQGWAPVGKRPQLNVNGLGGPGGGKKINLLIALTEEGVLHAESSESGYGIVQNFASAFDRLAGDLVRRELHVADSNDSKTYIIMDNLASHRNDEIRRVLRERKMNDVVEVHYLPPYSPQLNPVEYCNHWVKDYIRKARLSCVQEVHEALERAWLTLSSRVCRGFFHLLKPFLGVCAEGKPITGDPRNPELLDPTEDAIWNPDSSPHISLLQSID